MENGNGGYGKIMVGIVSSMPPPTLPCHHHYCPPPPHTHTHTVLYSNEHGLTSWESHWSFGIRPLQSSFGFSMSEKLLSWHLLRELTIWVLLITFAYINACKYESARSGIISCYIFLISHFLSICTVAGLGAHYRLLNDFFFFFLGRKNELLAYLNCSIYHLYQENTWKLLIPYAEIKRNSGLPCFTPLIYQKSYNSHIFFQYAKNQVNMIQYFKLRLFVLCYKTKISVSVFAI